MENLIKGVQNKKQNIVKHHDTLDIMTLLISKDKIFCDQTIEFTDTLKNLPVKDQCYEIWNYVHSNVKYIPDTSSLQQLKSPARLFNDLTGDCKSFSLFEACCLRNLGIPYAYRFVSFDKWDNTPTHVYVVANPKSKHPIIMDGILNNFNYEKPFSHKQDKVMLNMLTGVPEGAQIGSFKKWWTKHVTHAMTVNSHNAGKAVKHIIKEVGKVVDKINPAHALVRAGLVSMAYENIMNFASRFKPAQMTREEAAAKRYNLTEWDKLKNEYNKLLKHYRDIGGTESVLAKAIKNGKFGIHGIGAINKHVYLNDNTGEFYMGAPRWIQDAITKQQQIRMDSLVAKGMDPNTSDESTSFMPGYALESQIGILPALAVAAPAIAAATPLVISILKNTKEMVDAGKMVKDALIPPAQKKEEEKSGDASLTTEQTNMIAEGANKLAADAGQEGGIPLIGNKKMLIFGGAAVAGATLIYFITKKK